MPYIPSNPFIIEHATKISISDLKKWNFLKLGICRSGTLSWSIEDSTYAAVSLKSDMQVEDQCFIELKYICNDKDFDIKIKLESLPSNLGFGKVWYFVCPFTGGLCRKLYLNGEYFMSRQAILNAMYENQTKSQRDRGLNSDLDKALKVEKLIPELKAKNFKRHYNGVPTKRYLKLRRKIREFGQVGFPDVVGHIMRKR